MRLRIGITAAFCLCVAGVAAGQVVRFETTMGNFDMVLNPTHNTQLQGYVDNFLHYVDTDRYLGSWINRADKENGQDFVLQMGGFFSHTKRPSLTLDSVRPVATYDPVAGVPASSVGLSNTIGTVSLALPGDGFGGTARDAGTSSFFVNLANNSFLDTDFTVFAAISDLTVVNQIMDLQTIDRTTDPVFGADPGNLGFTSVPLQTNGFQVLIKRAFVVSDAMAAAKAVAGVKSLVDESAASFIANPSATPFVADASAATSVGELSVGSGSSAPLQLSPNTVPEPTGLILAAIGFGFYVRRRRR
jgi:cyclophilin family peptidyl-prolyl cis-trans isomerase